MVAALENGDKTAFEKLASYFLSLIDMQDRLLATMPDFTVGRWINDARRLAPSELEKDLFEQNARLLVTTWGRRGASEKGKLRDYAHREWNGLLRDFYRPRWEAWIAQQRDILDGKEVADIDFYAMDEKWVDARDAYSETPQGDPVEVSLEAIQLIKQ